jgi:hypothetical protein
VIHFIQTDGRIPKKKIKKNSQKQSKKEECWLSRVHRARFMT